MAKKSEKKPLPPNVRERNGRYTYRYSVEIVIDGERKRKQKETPSYDTPKEAYDAGILIEAGKIKGTLIDEKTVTLEQWCEQWLEDYKIEREPRPHTLISHQTALKSLRKYVGKNIRLKDIDPNDYQRWLNRLKADGKKKGTIQAYHVCASMIFKHAVKRKVIADNPSAGAVIPAFKQTLQQVEAGEAELPKYLERDELKKFLQVVRFRGKPQEYEFFLILAYTGLRIGELIALKTTDFDEQEQVLSITKTLTTAESIEEYHLGPPKNRTSIRKVTIGESVIKAIKAQLAWRESIKKYRKLPQDYNFLFWSVRFPGYPPRAKHLWRRFKALLKLAGLPENLSPHSLRHTHVSLLAEAGEDLTVIQERLGHKNDDITRRVYLHVTKEQKKLTPDRFEAVMRG